MMGTEGLRGRQKLALCSVCKPQFPHQSWLTYNSCMIWGFCGDHRGSRTRRCSPGICTRKERVPGERGRREHGGRRHRCRHCGAQVCLCGPGEARQFSLGRRERAVSGGHLRTRGGVRSAEVGECAAENTRRFLPAALRAPTLPRRDTRGAVPGAGARLTLALQFLRRPAEGARDRGGLLRPGSEQDFENAFFIFL